MSHLKVHHPELIACHSVIHQMVLCTSLGKEYTEIMTTVIRLVNFFEGTFLTKLMQNLIKTISGIPAKQGKNGNCCISIRHYLPLDDLPVRLIP